jgi:hypothetical protein
MMRGWRRRIGSFADRSEPQHQHASERQERQRAKVRAGRISIPILCGSGRHGPPLFGIAWLARRGGMPM